MFSFHDRRGHSLCLDDNPAVTRLGAHSMHLARLALYFSLPALLCAPLALAQSGAGSAACAEAPGDDALVSTCAPASLVEQENRLVVAAPPARIALSLPSGTPLRIALDQRARINHPGEVVHGKVVETVYAFDQPVIPVGSAATGHVTQIVSVTAMTRTLAYSNGNFSPFHKYQVTFDTVTLPDGRQLPIKTTVSPGTAEVVHLVSNPDKQKQKGVAGRTADNAKQEAKGKIQEAKDQVHESWEKLTAPGKMNRIKQYLLAQSPYRR